MTKRQDRTCGKLLQPLDTVTDVYDLIAGRPGNGPDSQPYPARPDLQPGRGLVSMSATSRSANLARHALAHE